MLGFCVCSCLFVDTPSYVLLPHFSPPSLPVSLPLLSPFSPPSLSRYNDFNKDKYQFTGSIQTFNGEADDIAQVHRAHRRVAVHWT